MIRTLRFQQELERRWRGRAPTPPPEWSLGPMYARAQELLWRDGEPVIGGLLYAHRGAFAEGTKPWPGRVVWSDDLFVQRAPDTLEMVRSRHVALGGRIHPSSLPPGLRALRPDPKAASLGRGRVPALLTGGVEVWADDILFDRRCLPTHRLRTAPIPLIRARSGTPPLVVMPPLDLWPPELVEVWERADAS